MTEPTGTQTLVTADAEKLDKLNAAFEQKRVQQIQLALPDNVSADKFLQIVNRALLDNPALMAADRPSLFTAVSQCAASGLEPDGKQAALVIYKTKVKTEGKPDTWIQKVQFMPMISGFRKIAGEHGWSIETDHVREADEFEYEGGLAPKLVHRRPKLGVERGPLVGAYSICRHRAHDPIVTVLDGTEVAKLKAASKTSKFGPWVDWEAEMWEKSAGRKGFKKLPLGEKESERIRALLTEITSGDDSALALMYGSQDRPALAAAPDEDSPRAAPSHAPPREGGGSGHTVRADQQQLRDLAERQDVDWDQIGATADEPQPVELTEAQRLGQTVIPGGPHADQTIADVCQTSEGQLWLLAVLSELAEDNPFWQAVAGYARGEQPEMWASYEAVKAAA